MFKKEEKIENMIEFLQNASHIIEKSNDDSKKEIIKQLNKYLFSIFNQRNELENFFNILKSIIFPIKSNENKNLTYTIKKPKNFIKQPFLLYPIIYSFNPKLSIEYIDYFLFSLKLSIYEENKSDFSFLSKIFSDIIDCFYNNNYNDKEKNIDNIQKEKLYQKLFSFIDNFLKINKKTEQSFGCLLLNEFIEKCPLVQEENNLSILFKEISIYLENKSFECKIDLLNCIISLIFRVKEKFKSHANVCLFRILDYLTDDDWIKRKLAINIVYTLVFYCKEEIMAVKENIIEFLNILKDDKVPEVREVCLETLKFIEEEEEDNNDFDEIEKEQNIMQKIKNENNNKISCEINYSVDISENKKNELIKEKSNNIEKNKNSCNNSLHRKNKSNLYKNNFNLYKNLNQNKLKDKFTLKKSGQKTKNAKNNKETNKKVNEILKKNSSLMKTFNIPSSINDYKQKKINRGNLTDRNNMSFNDSNILGNIISMNNSFIIKNALDISEEKEKKNLNKSIDKKTYNNLNKNKIKNNTKKLIKKDTNKELREKFIKEKALLEEIEKQLSERRLKPTYRNQYIEKKSLKLNNTKNCKNNKREQIINKKEEEKGEKVVLNVNKRQESESIIKYKESIDIPISNNNMNNENNEIDNNTSFTEINIENDSKPKYDVILEKLNKMQEFQNNVLLMIKELKNIVDMNYNNLDKRITQLESYHMNDTNLTKDINYSNELLKNKEILDKIKIEMIKNKFKSGKYNEALNESKENEKYLIKLLPLICNENISEIDLSIFEEIISELCKKFSNINKNKENNISIVLSFFKQIIDSKINLSSKTKTCIIESLKLLKNDNNIKLSKNDINFIDIIFKSFTL